jgi:hypothetical protein
MTVRALSVSVCAAGAVLIGGRTADGQTQAPTPPPVRALARGLCGH